MTLLPELAVGVEAHGLRLRKFRCRAASHVLAWRKGSPLREPLSEIATAIRQHV